jgi:hypothetical protein
MRAKREFTADDAECAKIYILDIESKIFSLQPLTAPGAYEWNRECRVRPLR